MIDSVPEELWTDVHDNLQEAGIKTIPRKKKCKKAKWLSEEILKISQKRREAEGKGKKGKIYSSECRVPKKQGEVRKSSSVISAKK